MRENIVERVFRSAFYIVRNKSTIRGTAQAIGVSKSTTHMDLQERLVRLDPVLHAQVYEVIDLNAEERYSRGGQATKAIYENRRR